MRIAVCDDDEQDLALLLKLIMEYQIERGVSFECRSFNNGTDLLFNMKGGEYDLVFLDVLMPGISGIQVAQELRELDQNVRLVFVSSSPEFAVESYSVGAYHYLLKPAETNTLFPLLDKAASELSVQEERGFVLKNREGIISILFTKLEYVEVINKTVSFHMLDGGIHKATAALADFEKTLLSRPEFLKTHRSYIVNLNYVQTIGTNCVITKNGFNIPVSRLLRNHVQDSYMNFYLPADTDIPGTDTPAAVCEKAVRPDGPWRILLVDDDPVDRNFWTDILRCHGCIVHQAVNGADAFKLASNEPFDCILLDVMIPDEDGLSLCKRLRKLINTPVIFLSCLTESDRQLEGFAAGGIDYITKNTPAELFWAKVETRIKLAISDRTKLCYGPLLLDLANRRILINEKELLLTPIEFDILQCLSEHARQVLTPENLFAMVWGGQPWDGGQMVQMHMSRLRRKLEKAWGEHHFIETVWGQGYRFVPSDD